MQTKTPSNLHILKLSFVHFAAGLLWFLIAMTAAIWLVPSIALNGTFRSEAGWLLAHMLVLGFASSIAIGASYQLIQVILRTSLFSRGLGWVQFFLYTIGLILILSGFAWNMRWVALGGLLTFSGMVFFGANIIMSMIRKKEWSPFVLGIALSVIAFCMTGVLGTMIGLRLAYGWSALPYDALFGSHVWMGIGGFLSGLIMVYSFKLLPMFYVSSKKVPLAAYWIIGGFHLGIWGHIASLWLGSKLLEAGSTLFLLAVFVHFVVYLYGVRRESRAKQPVGAVRVAFCLIPIMAGLFLIWRGLVLLGRLDWAPFTEGWVAFLIVGWLAPSIFSYLSKILPFLWWAHRFRTKEEKKGAVLLSDMLPEQRMTGELIGYLLGAAIAVCGFLIGSPAIAVLGQVLSVGFIFAYLIDLLRVFRY